MDSLDPSPLKEEGSKDVITRNDNEQIKNILEQGDVVISDTEHQCHTEQRKHSLTLQKGATRLDIPQAKAKLAFTYPRDYRSCCAEKIKRAGWNIDKSYPW